jgi:hypothetical protein
VLLHRVRALTFGKEEENMKARTVVLGLALGVIGAIPCFAQKQFMGTWKLNEAKSKIAAGAPKNSTVVYEPAGDSVKVTIDGTDGSGQPVHSEWTGKFDGNDYPVTGDASEDARSVEYRSGHHLGFKAKKGGKVTISGTIELSPNGKRRTVTSTSEDAQGKKVKSVAVYDKE